MKPGVGKGFQHPSGRVIALGRLMLATLFLLAIWIDASQPTRAPAATYAILAAYVAFAAATVAATWSDWWLDAKLAGPAHAVDILLFTLLVLLTEGQTSPFFTFFMFILLSAAIRWGWHATALTAMLLTLLYLVAGLLSKSGSPFEPQRFIVRTGHWLPFHDPDLVRPTSGGLVLRARRGIARPPFLGEWPLELACGQR